VINGTHHPYGYLNQEENEELGLNWLTFRYRNYMPEIGRFFGVDPIAEDFYNISTYQFAHNSPVWKIELEGLEGMPTAGIDLINSTSTPPPVDSGLSGTQATGSAQGAHVETTDSGSRFNGYKTGGQAEGSTGKVSGEVSGFSAGYEGTTEKGGAHGSASIYGVEADVGARLGTEDNNIAVEAEGSAFKAEVSGDAGLYTGGNGKYGVELGGEAGAYALEGDVTPSVSIGELKIGITFGGSLGSAHIGGRAAGTINSQTLEGEVTVMGHIGLGTGVKFGISISNTNQEVNRKKK